MSSTDIFWGIGDLLAWTFQLLQNDLPITWFMNYGILTLGFVGLFYWLNWQKKFNAQAENNPDQLK